MIISIKNSNLGMSLIELLVAIAIGALLLTGAASLLINNKRVYRTQNELGRVQENARFSIEKMLTDISMGGYYGCFGDVGSVTNNIEGINVGDAYDVSNPIEGFENAAANWQPSGGATNLTPVAGTDGITVRHMSGTTYSIATPYVENVIDDVYVDSASGFKENEYVIISDCKSSDIFKVTSVIEHDDDADTYADRLQLKHADGSGMNETANLGNKYTDDNGSAARMLVKRYYIADGEKGPALFLDGDELVEGVSDMEILYGINSDSDGDSDADSYVTATAVGAANWPNVVSVKMTLTFNIIDRDYSDVDPEPFTYTTTVRIRNNGI